MSDEKRTYEILEVLGKGGFGTVYLARMHTPDFQKLVAIKLLLDDVANPQVLQRFRDEARVLGLLRDRAIVQVDPPLRLDGRWAVVMEYVDGSSLSRILKRVGPLPARCALEVIAEVSRALDKAVRQEGADGQPLGLIHRDLKPGNIQLTATGEVKILDFGNARAQFAHRESETTTALAGTPGYIAPERFSGVEDPRGDVFSMGGVLYRLLTGTLPEASSDYVPPDDPLTTATLDLARKMRTQELDQRMTHREVEKAAHALLEGATGPRLRAWAEEYVPARSRTRPDALVGSHLSITLDTPEPGPRRSLAPIPVSEPETITLPPPPVPRWPFFVGLVISVAGSAVCVFGIVVALVVPGVQPPDAMVVVADTEEPQRPDPTEPADTGPPDEPPQPVVAVPPEPEPEPRPEPAPVAPVRSAPPPPQPAPEPVEAPPEPVPEPEPVPAEPVVTYSVYVGSKPLGLPIRVDGESKGSAPRTVEIPRGTHRLQVGDDERTIEVGPMVPDKYVYDADAGAWAAPGYR